MSGRSKVLYFRRLVQTKSKTHTTFHSILLAVSFPHREAAGVKTVHIQAVVRLRMHGVAHPLLYIFIVVSFFLQSVFRHFDLIHLIRVKLQIFEFFR
jgi:hypothetical protein